MFSWHYLFTSKFLIFKRMIVWATAPTGLLPRKKYASFVNDYRLWGKRYNYNSTPTAIEELSYQANYVCFYFHWLYEEELATPIKHDHALSLGKVAVPNFLPVTGLHKPQLKAGKFRRTYFQPPLIYCNWEVKIEKLRNEIRYGSTSNYKIENKKTRNTGSEDHSLPVDKCFRFHVRQRNSHNGTSRLGNLSQRHWVKKLYMLNGSLIYLLQNDHKTEIQ